MIATGHIATTVAMPKRPKKYQAAKLVSKTERRPSSGRPTPSGPPPCYCGVGVAVGSGVGVASGVAVGSGVAVASGVGVAVDSGVGVAVASGVGVGVGVGVGTGVGVGIVPDLISFAFSAASVLMTSDACYWLSASMACCL